MSNHDEKVMHDLRSSLSVMRSIAEAQLLTAPEESRDIFETFIEQVDRMTALVAELSH